jgi:hypothetical protein
MGLNLIYIEGQRRPGGLHSNYFEMQPDVAEAFPRQEL